MSAVATSTAAWLELELHLALADFELDVRIETRARSLALFGPSGAGKTSIVEVIAGWRRGARGLVRVQDRVMLDSARGIDVAIEERGIGLVTQDLLLMPHKNVRENVLGSKRADDGDTFRRSVDVLEIGPLLDRRPATLSGGERARVALARALCSRPRLLLLDEPLSALDLALRRRVLAYLVRVREAFDVPLVLVTHDATEVQALCDEVVVLERGRVSAFGSARAVLAERATTSFGFENVLRGSVVSASDERPRVEIAHGAVLQVAGPARPTGSRTLVALRAEDVLVATGSVEGLSARNALSARIAALRFEGDDAWLTADVSGCSVIASLTRTSVEELGLRVGSEVRLVLKTQACRLIG